MKKTRIVKEVEVNASKEKVWEVLANFGDVYKTSRGIKKSHLTSEQKTGVGTTRHCDLTTFGAQVEERIVEWDEGTSLKIDIYERKNLPLMADLTGAFSVKEQGKKTVLQGTMEYSMTGGLGDLMNNVMMKRMSNKNWISLLAGIKYHAETGEEVAPNTVLDMKAVKAV